MTKLHLSHLLPDSSTISPAGILHIANHSIPALAEAYGTPLYIYDRWTIINACKQYFRAFETQYSACPLRILYASKAYLCPLSPQLMVEQGTGSDVRSRGELLGARHATRPLDRLSSPRHSRHQAE